MTHSARCRRRLCLNGRMRLLRDFFCCLVPATVVLASPALAAERELDREPPPKSASKIQTPIERVTPEEEPGKPPLFPWFRQRLEKLPSFFADTRLEARFRTYYLRKDRTSDELSETWALGGSIAYRSGWLEDLFAVEVEGFTSQRLVGHRRRDGTQLLEPGQEGYSVLGIANGKLRYKGLVLTGFRQYLDLPYVNRQDSRMTPQTFESITLAKPEGELRFSTGYTWNVKQRDSDEFESLTEAIGLSRDRGLAHAGAVWDPNESFHLGGVFGVIPDLLAGIYAESGYRHRLADGLEARFDGQFTYRWDVGDDLLGNALDDAWNFGLRPALSYAGAVVRLGLVITGPSARIESHLGTSPSYVDLMQRGFTLADEKALLASLSYDFAGLGADGLSAILNFVASFDGRRADGRDDAREIDLTLDYRLKQGPLRGFWLRARGSWLDEERTSRDGTDIRVILRYDFPVI